MAGGARGSVVRSIQTLLDSGPVAGLTDGQLLDRFLGREPEAAETAFEAIVRLHGPMVWGVCRGAIADTHDAEDAFQAVFLVLVRKAGSVRRRDTLGPWLYGVARRVAVRARRGAARRRRREGTEVDEMATSPAPDPMRREDVEALHQELDRLPEKYRAVVVLCHLEGRTQAEAARLLGCPIGTVGVRITRAREILRGRLTRRGLALPAAMAGAAFPSSSASAGVVPAALAASTVKAAMGVAAGKSLAAGTVSAGAAQLAQGVLKTMTMIKLSFAASCVLTLGIASSGVGWVALGDGPAEVRVQQPAEAPSDRDEMAAKARSTDNLKNIALAINVFAAAHGGKEPRYPEPSISKDGKPLLSWRVAILPYLDGCKPLYDKFYLDEPWDSPHNKLLLKEMPAVYEPVVEKAVPRSFTYYQAFVGPGTFFDPEPTDFTKVGMGGREESAGPRTVVGKGGARLVDTTDGTSNTLMVAEAATPVPWTKPEDLNFDKDKPLPKLGGQFADGFHTAFADGSVLFLKRETDPVLLRALITRAGGEFVDRRKLFRTN